MDYKKLREQLGLTQTQVARKVGVSLYAYQQWERGVLKPKPSNQTKLNEVLGVK
jgi:transcriptional regulator with XRE-family HTH domain